MEKALAAIWREAFKLERIDIHRSFFDLGGDSLMVVGVISEINRTLGVDIGVPEFFQNPTVEKLARVIEERRLLRKRRSEVVELRAGRANYPVYFIYAGPDEFRLAQLMNADHSIFGIDVKWPLAWRTAVADNRKSAFPSMEQLSAPFASALAAHARSSPVVLVGHSLAGLIAFEVAHQYQKLGGNVEMVVLIDTWARRPGAYQIARHNFMDCWKQPWNRLVSGGHTQSIGSRLRKSLLIAWRLLGQQMHEARAFFQEYFAQKPRSLTTLCDEEGNPLPGEIVRRLYLGIRDSYRLCPLDAPGTLFRAKSADGRREGCAPDDSLGWRDLFTRGFETIPITGDHLSMIREHNLALARELDQVLMRRWPDQREAVNIAAVLAADR